MRLFLYHGRKTVDEEVEDWGYDGPTIEDVNYLHDTYHSNLTIAFRTRAAMHKAIEITGWEIRDKHAYLLQVPITEGLMKTKEGFFGDWDFKDDDDAFWCWRRDMDMYAKRIYGINIEDMEPPHDHLRALFLAKEDPEEMVLRFGEKLGLEPASKWGGRRDRYR